MKTLKVIVAIGLVAIAFTSCKKEEEDVFSMVGKWNIEMITARVFVGNVEVLDPMILENQGYMLFNENKTGSINNADPFSWSLSGDILKITFDNPGDDEFLLIISGQPSKLTTKEKNLVVAEYSVEKNIEGVDAVVKVVFKLSRA